MSVFANLLARSESPDKIHYEYPPQPPRAPSIICSYPLSGQYGPGTRYLYYGLVAVCIFARRREWLREPCLAAALLLPALASIHAIVLACYSNGLIVDLDIYGVLVFIAVATLAMPLTLRFSRTYFNTPGRNLVFLCAILNLAGLVSLSIAFFQAKPQPCTDRDGSDILNATTATVCWWNCTNLESNNTVPLNDTAIRDGSNGGMQVVFAPRTGVTLNTGFLLSVAFCVLACLSIVTMWNQVVLDNARRLGFIPHDTSILPKRKGEGDHSRGGVKGVLDWISHPPDNFSEGLIKLGLHLIELLVYSTVMLATIIISEITFWSAEMRQGVEPMTSVGQWSPIVGAVISSLGALYCALDTEETPAARARAEQLQHGVRLVMSPAEDKDAQDRRFNSLPLQSPITPDASQPETTDIAGRRRVAEMIRKASTLLDPDPERFNNRAFLEGEYKKYPRTPGEEVLNPDLHEHEARFYQARRARSVSSLVIPGIPSRSPTPVPETTKPLPRHARSDSGGSQYLEVPQVLLRALSLNSIVSESLPPTSSLGLDNVPPQFTNS